MTINPTKEFDLGNALTFALLSQAAYLATADIYCQATDTAVVFTETDTDLMIGFPGTRDLADVLKDAEVWRTPRRAGAVRYEVHAGFGTAYDSVAIEVFQRMTSASSVTKRKWVYGHSKGGALATLCAAHLRTTDVPVAGVYTFGEPRSGDRAWADYCDSQFGEVHFRVEDELDSVTRLPGWIAGNRHSGQDVFIYNAFGGPQIDMNPVLWFKALTDAWMVWRAKSQGVAGIADLVRDHHIGTYIARLQALNKI